jgi:hypothetical protein
MNEQIKYLAMKSGLSIRGHYDESGSTPAELQKFAELIIKDQHREWVGLTDEDINSWDLPDKPTVAEFARFVEDTLRSKNT